MAASRTYKTKLITQAMIAKRDRRLDLGKVAIEGPYERGMRSEARFYGSTYPGKFMPQSSRNFLVFDNQHTFSSFFKDNGVVNETKLAYAAHVNEQGDSTMLVVDFYLVEDDVILLDPSTGETVALPKKEKKKKPSKPRAPKAQPALPAAAFSVEETLDEDEDIMDIGETMLRLTPPVARAENATAAVSDEGPSGSGSRKRPAEDEGESSAMSAAKRARVEPATDGADGPRRGPSRPAKVNRLATEVLAGFKTPMEDLEINEALPETESHNMSAMEIFLGALADELNAAPSLEVPINLEIVAAIADLMGAPPASATAAASVMNDDAMEIDEAIPSPSPVAAAAPAAAAAPGIMSMGSIVVGGMRRSCRAARRGII